VTHRGIPEVLEKHLGKVTLRLLRLVELISGLDEYGERDVNQMGVPHWLIGLVILALPVAFVVFAFRQGQKVKPDPNNRHGPGDWAGGGAWGPRRTLGLGLNVTGALRAVSAEAAALAANEARIGPPSA
jgi:hypothetical protein